MEPNSEDRGKIVFPETVKRIERNPHILLADGNSYKGVAVRSPIRDAVQIWLEQDCGITMAEAFQIFSDPAKTKTITYKLLDIDSGTVFEGYTTLNTIQTDYDGKLSIRMVK